MHVRLLVFQRWMSHSPAITTIPPLRTARQLTSLQLTFHDRWVSRNQRVGRDVTYHNTSRRYDTAVSNRDTRTNRHATAQPAIVANRDGMAGFNGLHPFLIVNGVLRREKLTTWANFAMSTDFYVPAIKHDAIVIDESVLTNGYPMAMVTMKWRDNNRRGWQTGNERLHKFTVFRGRQCQLRYSYTKLVGPRCTFEHCFVFKTILQGRPHLLKFCHIRSFFQQK